MKKSVIILSVFMSLCHISVAFAHDPEKQVKRWFNQAVQAESIPGISVAVADHSGVWARGFGYADLEHQVLMTSQTKL